MSGETSDHRNVLRQFLRRLEWSAVPCIDEFADRAKSLYRDNLIVQGVVQAIFVFGLVCAIDALIGFPLSTRALYILPLWIATRKAGPFWAIWVVVGITAFLTSIEHYAGYITHENIAIHSVLRFGSLLTLMLMIWAVERKLEAVRVQALHDSLTGVLNRTALRQYASYQIDRAFQNNESLVLALVDCDKFKAINDEFGHKVGDFILRLLGRHLETASRPTGMVARTGGDEFVVVLQNTSLENARSLLLQIGANFARTTEERGCRATISFGLACLGVDGRTLESLMHAADVRMYAAKENQHAVVEPVAAPGPITMN